MNIQKEAFGVTKSDKPVTKYILSNDNGMEVHILDYGAIITSIIVPDKDGNLDDIALGYDSIAEYEDNGPSYGAFIGRNSNRIQNASFELNGTVYNLDKNDGNNNLHGGYTGYHKIMYEATTLQDDTSVSIELSRLSPHMEQGFPGNLEVKVIYSLTNDNQLIIKYHAVSDQDTVVNLTNHSYFNLSGHNAGSVLDHKVWIKSDSFTPTDDNLIPTGEIADVTNTPMDFRQLKTLGKDINADYPPLKIAGGYDHNYVLNKETSGIERIAQLIDDKSGRVMDVYTDLPGMQLYSGNFMPTEKGKVGATYQKRYGVCFETQYYPNNINQPSFPSSVLRAGEEFNSTTIYKFS